MNSMGEPTHSNTCSVREKLTRKCIHRTVSELYMNKKATQKEKRIVRSVWQRVQIIFHVGLYHSVSCDIFYFSRSNLKTSWWRPSAACHKITDSKCHICCFICHLWCSIERTESLPQGYHFSISLPCRDPASSHFSFHLSPCVTDWREPPCKKMWARGNGGSSQRHFALVSVKMLHLKITTRMGGPHEGAIFSKGDSMLSLSWKDSEWM